jgi:outer membrane scaffolding protein for murein synthesis (MipA/OmpV family)
MISVRNSLFILTGCAAAGTVFFLDHFDRAQGEASPGVSVESSPAAVSDENSTHPAPTASLENAPPLERQLSAVGPLTSLRLTPRRNAISAGPISPPRPATADHSGNGADAPSVVVPLQSSENLSSQKGTAPKSPEAVATAPDRLTVSPNESNFDPAKMTYALGVGLDNLPRWQGARKTELRRIPYININWQDQIELSTVKGLIVDVIHGEKWHGGLIGTLVWGRSTRDLNGLNVPTLKNTLQGGLYLEYALTPALSVGVRLRQDIQNTGVSYGEAYAELELPKIGYLEHDIRISQEAMNRTGMRRFFGLSARDAAQLGSSSYAPQAGLSKTSITYEGFHPTSESTGFVFGATIGRLNSEASNSPLVKNYGAAVQKEFFGAFLYHF